MPHFQKENHDHKSKSKKEKQKKREALLARKKAALAKEAEEEEEKLKLSNNIPLAEGFGAYEVGCEEEEEFVAKVNLKKRNKKHLRRDIRRQDERRKREEEERLKKEQEEKYRLEQEKLKEEQQADEEEDEDEEEPIIEEYLVYICLCCRKKFNSANQFRNHLKSKKHRINAKLYEEAGVIVTEVQRKEDVVDDDDYSYEDDIEEEEYETDGDSIDEHENKNENGSNHDSGHDEESSEDEEEYYEEPKKVGGLFGAMAMFDDSDSSSSSSSDSEEENGKIEHGKEESEIETKSVASTTHLVEDDSADEYDDDLDLLEEIIYQNRLQERFYPDDDIEEKDTDITPVYFDEEQYDPDNFNADENRLAAVQFRLQKRLAQKGIQPSQISAGYKTPDAVSIGKTLLQQVMAASMETLEEKLAAYNRHKAEYQLLGREFRFAKGNSKALPSQYSFRIDPADNQRRRENVHHTGSHYHMQAARSMQFGRTKGLMARHSSQGSRLQASRMAAKEMAKIHGKGMKIGKTSKKSQQKRRGEAGGSKKSGGTGTSEK